MCLTHIDNITIADTAPADLELNVTHVCFLTTASAKIDKFDLEPTIITNLFNPSYEWLAFHNSEFYDSAHAQRMLHT